MKRSEINILKDLESFTFEFDESADVNDFFAKFGVAVNLCGEGRYQSVQFVISNVLYPSLIDLNFQF